LECGSALPLLSSREEQGISPMISGLRIFMRFLARQRLVCVRISQLAEHHSWLV
jgi:hypothetical protein